MSVAPAPSLKGRALRLLGNREYSRAELERKLAPHAPAPEDLMRALDELQSKGFIDEQRVLESVIHRRAARLGAVRIRQELQQKGLDQAAVSAAVAGLQASELTRARDVWQKKFGTSASTAAPPSLADRARQARFLAARGFGGDTIRRVIAAAGEPDDPPAD